MVGTKFTSSIQEPWYLLKKRNLPTPGFEPRTIDATQMREILNHAGE